jgi:hypothetical protein
MKLSPHRARIALAVVIVLTVLTLLALSGGLWQSESVFAIGVTPNLPLILRDHNPAVEPTSPPPTPFPEG